VGPSGLHLDTFVSGGPGAADQELALHFPPRKGRKGGCAPSGRLGPMRIGDGKP